jgi:transcription initiation factor IIE alpha subunit
MITKSLNRFPTKFRQAVNSQFCPECGARMKEVDRRRENGALFVWYHCSKKECEGQWLQKTSPMILNSL